MPDIMHDTPADTGPDAPVDGDLLARQQAIKQIERRRRFWIGAAWSSIAMVILVAIWATSESTTPAAGRPRDSARVRGSMTCGTSGS